MAKRMNHVRYPALATGALLFAFVSAPAQEQITKAPSPQNREAKVLLTAIDKDQHFVETLRADDLQVLEDGKPQRIISFSRIMYQPVSLAILIDSSGSQEQTLPVQKMAASSFVESVITSSSDQASIASFTGIFKIERRLTSNVQLLQKAISNVEFVAPPGSLGGVVVVVPSSKLPARDQELATETAIWDSIASACNEILVDSPSGRRRAIILLTDGHDSISKLRISDAIESAIANNVAIYSIGIGDEKYGGVDKAALRKLSERTGGRAFVLKKTMDLRSVFGQIARDLRSPYMITYETDDVAASFRKLRIEIVKPALRAEKLQLSYQRFSGPDK